MNNIKRIFLAILFGMPGPTFAFDATDLYFGGLLGKAAVDDVKVDGTQKIVYVGLPLDYQLGDFETAVEFDFVKFDSDDAQFIGGTAGKELDFISFADGLVGFGKLGYLLADPDDEVTFGAGLDYPFNDNFSGRTEYLFAGDLEIWTIGIKYNQ